MLVAGARSRFRRITSANVIRHRCSCSGPSPAISLRHADSLTACGASRSRLRSREAHRAPGASPVHAWLKRAGGRVLGQVEDHGVRMELRGIPVHRSRTVVFEQRRHEVAGRLGSAIAAEPRLNVRLQFVERQPHAFAVGLTDVCPLEATRPIFIPLQLSISVSVTPSPKRETRRRADTLRLNWLKKRSETN